LRNLHTVFYRGTYQCSIFPYPGQHLLLFVLLLIAVLTRVMWNHNVIWFAFPLWPRKLTICSYTYCPFSFDICLFISFCHLFSWLLILSGVNFLRSLCILVIILFSDVQLSKIFSFSVVFFFNLVTVSVDVHKLFVPAVPFIIHIS
jgi:hypothetical protein